MKKANLLVAALLVMSFAGGCGNTNQNTDTTQQTQQTQVVQTAYDKFEKVPMRATYDQVKQILGVDGQPVASNTIGNVTTESFNFFVGSDRIYMTFQNGKLSTKQVFTVKPCDKKITLDQFNKIQMGMTYDQVKQILGCDGVVWMQTQYSYGYASKSMVWLNNNGEDARIGFDNNGVVKSKVQRGLH